MTIYDEIRNMLEEELTALQTVRDEYKKIKDKYLKKAAKERAKVNDVYVMVCGEKCYTDSEINDWYASDYITCEQSDKYIEKQNKKKATTDKLTAKSSKSKIAKITGKKVSKGKVTVTVKGAKKGTSKLTIKIGKKSVKVTVKVK